MEVSGVGTTQAERDRDPSRGDGDDDGNSGDGDGDGDGDMLGDGDVGDGDAQSSGDGDGDGDGGNAGDGDDAPIVGNMVDQDAVALFVTRSDESELLHQRADLRFVSSAGVADLTIEVDPSQSYQAIDGFGAQLTDSASYLFDVGLDQSEHRSLVRRLFDPDAGIGLSVLRQPIGASNFARSLYTYDDTPPDGRDFSILHEQEHTIPLLREIRAIQPDLLLFAAPFSAPAWMKSNGSLFGGSLEPHYFGAFAEYLADFVSAYLSEGLPVYALSPQNEPYYSPDGADTPTMFMEASAQAEFVLEHLAPLLEERQVGTQIMAWDHNWDYAESYTEGVMSDARVREHVAGTGFHCYLGDAAAQTRVHERYPEKQVWLTECSARSSLGGFAGLFTDTMSLGLNVMNNWSRTFMRGSLALDDRHGPRVGGCTDCTGTLEIASNGSFSVSGEFYALGHFAKFVKRAATRIATRASGDTSALAHAAFVNPDGSRVLVLFNRSDAELSFRVLEHGKALRHTIPAHSAMTLHWARTGGPLSLADARISASGIQLVEAPEQAIDGNPETRWSTGLPQNGQQWLELDLGDSKVFSALTLDAADSTLDYPRGYELEASSDGQSWTTLATGSGDAALFTVRFARTEARYLRITCTGETTEWWSVHELALHR